ncbi:Low specificity phosphatase (HAD superfamily)-like protein [Fibrisoma limi BUZ 3]|uniref:Low specificity phosphatase (HAD superfamily)-like protein n=1 Tax=Fibrisoma limi BUZ 3 TaxID=1185876 RepID=I2GEJ3_9BACT|nr:phosphatase [Fibrisoma limi]CCH52318.1 Low specificity phosphatase (HAD superfamily)-like protein [Fibrisoma limi BUZ 3]
MINVEQTFTALGGQFITPAAELAQKLRAIKAVVFDWDGVFNDGIKTGSGSSPFSEVDSMGTNLLRFGFWLHHGRTLPAVAIVTGVTNEMADLLAAREHFHACYSQAKHKIEVLAHFLDQHGLQPQEVAFFFDDALDLSVAEVAGVRIMIRRTANPLFTQYVIQNNYADYVTAHMSGQFAVREGCELMLGLLGQFEPVMVERLRYRPVYDQYYAQRQAVEPMFWTVGPDGPERK